MGHQVPKKVIFGMYDIERKVGVCEFVVDKSQEALFPLIQQYILPGSIIHSDSAAMYVSLHTDPPSSHIASIPVPIPYAPYQHLWVNHRENFVNPLTGACTNHIECFWKNSKNKIRKCSERRLHCCHRIVMNSSGASFMERKRL